VLGNLALVHMSTSEFGAAVASLDKALECVPRGGGAPVVLKVLWSVDCCARSGA
jgi:hypothetical protein